MRAARLLDAQAKAAELFAAIEPRGIIAPGVREVEASNAIRDLAAGDVRGGPALAQADRPGRAEHPAAVPAQPAGPGDRRGRHRVPATSGRSSRVGGRLRPDLRARRRPGQAAAAGRAAGHVPRGPPVLRGARGRHRRAAVRVHDRAGRGGRVDVRRHDRRATWWASSRTRRSRARTSSPTSRPAATSRCAGPTATARPATGSSRSTWSTAAGRSAGSSRSCSTSAPARPGYTQSTVAARK